MLVAVYMYNSISICADLSIIILPFAVDIPMAGGYTINCREGVSVAPRCGSVYDRTQRKNY